MPTPRRASATATFSDAAFNAINALSPGTTWNADCNGRLDARPWHQWVHDLMERDRTGRVFRLDIASGAVTRSPRGCTMRFGACAAGDAMLVSESWRHRLDRRDARREARRTVLDHLPVYPSRLSQASGGGFWLTAFTARTQLVEFVLREPGYRRRMMAEIDPDYWIAPKLKSGHSFKEPMQGAHIKTMGVIKPWAPPRSYGLVIRLDADGQPLYSLHSRVDGVNHGVVAAIEMGDDLVLIAKGPGRVLRLPSCRPCRGIARMSDIVLSLRKATKLYAGVPAIEGVDFELRRGEIHALVGENGAGKSTLTKVMAGVVTLTSGTMMVERRRCRAEDAARGAQSRHRHGVPGEQPGADHDGRAEPVSRAGEVLQPAARHLHRRAAVPAIAQFRRHPDRDRRLLGAAKKQMVEIARAVLHRAKVIIFDEPTATLTPEEKKYFFDLVRDLKRRGVSIVFISHALEEALMLADRITMLRDGKHVVTDDVANFDRAAIVQAMVGRDLSNTLYGTRKTSVRPAGARVLTVQNLKMAPMVKNNSLSVFAGQITGVFGLVGAGRTETFKVVAGVLKRDFFHGGE